MNNTKTAWGKNGFDVTQAVTDRTDLCEASNLNWTVHRYPMKITTGSRVLEVPDYHALVREPDGKFLGLGKRIEAPLQNKDVIEFFKKFMFLNGTQINVLGECELYHQIWVAGKTKYGFYFEDGQDQVTAYLLLSYPHAIGKGLKPRLLLVREASQTVYTEILSGYGNQFHYVGRDQWDESLETKYSTYRETLKKRVYEIELACNRLTKIGITDAEAREYITNVYYTDMALSSVVMETPKNTLRTMEYFHRGIGSEFSVCKGTLWGAFNAICYFLDWVSFGRGLVQEKRMSSSWFGTRATSKQKALKLAINLASQKEKNAS